MAVNSLSRGRANSRALRSARMTSRVSVLSIATVALYLCASTRSCAETVSLQPIADTTLFQVAPGNNLGGAGFFNAGTAGNGNRNRALLRFDFSGSIPTG